MNISEAIEHIKYLEHTHKILRYSKIEIHNKEKNELLKFYCLRFLTNPIKKKN